MYYPAIIRFVGILGILNGALLTMGIWTGVSSVYLHLFTIPFSALCLFLIEKTGSSLGSIMSGWNPGRADYREQFSAELEKIKYSKRMEHFDDALRLVNELLHKDPDFPDALFLKAHILWEGFGNSEASKGILKRVKQLVPEDETLHRWASIYYDEVDKRMKDRQAQ